MPIPVNDLNIVWSQTLASLIDLLKSKIGNDSDPTQTRVNKPEPFTGQDPKKLAPFLLQCRFNFRDQPAAFASDFRKVNFALSYLKDSAATWFEPAISDLTTKDPDWLHNWDAFVGELQTNFGPYDPVGDAETAISNLKMKENQRIIEYIVQFNSLAARCDWGDSALRYHFYSGLPSRLKDEVSQGETGKPKILADMRLKAQNADARYWERRLEKNRELTSELVDEPGKDCATPRAPCAQGVASVLSAHTKGRKSGSTQPPCLIRIRSPLTLLPNPTQNPSLKLC
jgi:hypothetical protein